MRLLIRPTVFQLPLVGIKKGRRPVSTAIASYISPNHDGCSRLHFESYKHRLSRLRNGQSTSHYSTLKTLPEFISACSLQGRRPYQEDRYVIAHLSPDLSFMACYDGHGGDEAAEFAQEHLHKYFYKLLSQKRSCTDALRESISQVCTIFLQNIYICYVNFCLSPYYVFFFFINSLWSLLLSFFFRSLLGSWIWIL